MPHTLKSLTLRLVGRLVRPFVAHHNIIGNPYVTGKLLPLDSDKGRYITLRANASALSELPVPPVELWEGYGQTPEEYLASGREHMDNMLGILRGVGESPETMGRVLEVGCAAGRMLRHYPHEGAEVWGVDINARHIAWCQANLSPPFMFATTTTAPHLPFEDNHFALVYAGSVFTHVSDLADAWFLELRRVLRPGGYAYITIHDESAARLFLEHGDSFVLMSKLLRQLDDETGVLSKPYAAFGIDVDPVSQIFYSREWLVKKWAQWMEFVSASEEAYGFQTALLFRKP